jgi:serine/threonine protein kinase
MGLMEQFWVGKKIGNRYQIEALLGQGGMSAVYRAYDPNLRRKVAIKLIHPHLSSDPNFVGRFKEEAAAVARLRHPNIVQVHDFDVDGETYYMVMEYLVGETLQAKLKRLNGNERLMPFDEALSLCIQLCEAIGYAHDHELVHRDIKPANIMLNVNGQAILMDFGIVKIVGGDYHTSTGATIGTAMYMSPEQIRSTRIDDRADIYSLGVSLYEMLSGQPPYMADSAPTLMMMVLNDPLPDLHGIRKGIPDSLVAAVNKALAKDPAERFQSMAEMETALRNVQAKLDDMHPALATTLVDEDELEQESLLNEKVTVVESQAEGENSKVDFLQEGIKTPSKVSLVDAPLEIVNDRPPYPVPGKNLVARLCSRHTLLITISLLLLTIVIVGILFTYARKPPELLLQPISRPIQPITAQSTLSVVSLGQWETNSFIEELTFSPDGDLLGTANNRETARFSQYRFYNGLWQVQAGVLQNYLFGHTQRIFDIGFSSDGQLFGSASEDGSVLLWQVIDGSFVRKIEGTHSEFTSIAFSSNNLLLATGTGDGTVNLWQINNGNLLRTLQEDDDTIVDVDFSPDGTLMAAASYNNSIILWHVSDGNLEQILQDHTAPVYEVVFSPDGSLLASASEDHTIKIWQVSDGSLLQTMRGHTEAVLDIAFSPDSLLLASGSSDGKLLLWQVDNGVLLSTLAKQSDSINSVTFSPDSLLLVSGTEEGSIQFWGISEAIPLGND